MEIIKAEILWSRKCNLRCGYCAMADGRDNTPSPEHWELGLMALKHLGCQFVAVYGAEPLLEFDKLTYFIKAMSRCGIENTVITGAGMTKDYFNDCMNELVKCGLDSLSMSYDMVPLNPSSRQKQMAATFWLDKFRYINPNYKNVAAIATVTKINYQSIPETIMTLSKRNIWFFFDFIHPYRGQAGSKCKDYPGSQHLLFSEKDLASLVDVLQHVEGLKRAGYKCHSSKLFLDMIIEDPTRLLKYDWNCADEDNFPAWVTVDCDGRVYPCDDFQMRITSPKIYVWELDRRWEEFCDFWKVAVKQYCTGCLWNTHIDAHAIKRGMLPLTDYVHRRA